MSHRFQCEDCGAIFTLDTGSRCLCGGNLIRVPQRIRDLELTAFDRTIDTLMRRNGGTVPERWDVA